MIENSHVDEKLLNEYMDGMLSMALATKLEAHLADCLECQERLAEIRMVFQALGALPEAHLQIDLVNGVMKKIEPLPMEEPMPSLSSRVIRPRRSGDIAKRMDWSALLHMKSLGWFSLVQMLSALILLFVSWSAILQMIPTQFFAYILEHIDLTRQEILTTWWLRWNSVWSSLQVTPEIVFDRWYGQLNQLVLLQISLDGLIVITLVVFSLWIIVNGLLFTMHNSNGYASFLRRRI